MKIQLSFFLLLLIHTLSFSQNYDCKEDLIPKQGDNRMFGYINLLGEWKVIPFYDRVYPFQGNVAIVLKGKKYGLLDCVGKVVLRPEYDEIKSFTNGYAWVKKDEKWGIIDFKGDIILQPAYEEVEDIARFSEYAWVKKDGLWGVFAKHQKRFVHLPVFQSYKMLNAHFSLVKNTNGLLGIINYDTGIPVIEPQFESATKLISNALAVEKNGKVGLISDEGKWLSEVVYDSIKRVHQFRLVIAASGNSFLANEKGKQLSKRTYDEVGEYSGGAFRVKSGGNYGFLNYIGQEVIPPQYTWASDFVEGKAIVQKNDSAYIINPRNETLTKGFQEIIRPEKNYFLVKELGVWGLMDKQLNNRLPAQFSEVFYADQGLYIRAKKSEGFYLLNLTTFTTINTVPYDNMESFYFGSAIVSKGDKYGLIDSLNTPKIPLMYKSLERLSRTHFLAQTDVGFGLCDSRGKTIGVQNYAHIQVAETWPLVTRTKAGFGLIDEKGVEVLKPVFSEIRPLGENYFSLRKGKKVGVVDAQGNEVLLMEFEAVDSFAERYFLVKKNGLWGYVDNRAKVMIDFQYSTASPFQHEQAKATIEGKAVVIDKKGKVINK